MNNVCWFKNVKCPRFEQQAAITQKRYEIGCQLLLITNRKLHTGFRLIPTLVTLNDLERRNRPYFAFFTEFDCFAGQLRHSCWRQRTYNVHKVLSTGSSLLILAETNASCSAAIAEHLVLTRLIITITQYQVHVTVMTVLGSWVQSSK